MLSEKNLCDDKAAPPQRLVKLARAHIGNVSPAQSRRGWQLLQERSLRRTPQRRWMVLAALVPSLALAGLWLRSHTQRTLGFTVSSGHWEAGQLSARDTAPAAISFSDGTNFALAPGATGVLGEVDAHGAEFRLKQGHMDLSVTRRSGARWSVNAGPFKISVIGTKFSVDWQEQAQRLEVVLHKGEVHVAGPPISGLVKLAVGQRLWVDVAAQEVRIAQTSAAAPNVTQIATPTPAAAEVVNVEPSLAPTVHALRPQTTKVAVSPRAPKVERPADSWTTLVRSGDFDGVVQAAQSMGLAAALATRPAADLGALADAARYQRRPDMAVQALLAIRKRFTSHSLATEAAFQLGRIEETAGNRKGALGWYTQYLKDAPRGAFVGEAMGRQMEGVAHLQGRNAARPLAENYLRKFPTGDFAETARALVATSVIK